MFQRLFGLLVIIRALTPVFIVLIVAALGSVILNDLRNVLQGPVNQINSEVSQLQNNIETAKQNFQDVSDHVTTVVSAIGNVHLPDLNLNIPSSISIPNISIPSISVPVPTASISTSTYSFGRVNLGVTTVNLGSITYPSGISIGTTNKTLSFPSIPAFNIPIPGLDTVKTAVNGALTDVKNQFDSVSSTFTSISVLSDTLKGVNDHVNSIVVQTQNAMTSVGNLASQWGSALVIALFVILALVINYTFTSIVQDFTRGWNLLLGRSVN